MLTLATLVEVAFNACWFALSAESPVCMMLPMLNVHLRPGPGRFLPEGLQILPTERFGVRNLPGRPVGLVSTGEVLNLLNDCVKRFTPALLRLTVPTLRAAS